jgi:hypothetical protein
MIKKMRGALVATMVCGFVAGKGFAADVDIPYTEFMLDNGLKVIVH